MRSAECGMEESLLNCAFPHSALIAAPLLCRLASPSRSCEPRARRWSRRSPAASTRAAPRQRSTRAPFWRRPRGAAAGSRGSSAEEALQVAQVIGERHGRDGEPEREDQAPPIAGLAVAPRRPHREPRGEHDRGRNEQAVERDHDHPYVTTLSSTISVSSAGRYTIDTKNTRHARGAVAASVSAADATR